MSITCVIFHTGESLFIFGVLSVEIILFEFFISMAQCKMVQNKCETIALEDKLISNRADNIYRPPQALRRGRATSTERTTAHDTGVTIETALEIDK